MMIPRPPSRRKPDFSLATINIVFLLLLFFLAVGTVTEGNEISIAVPETSDLPLDRLPKPLLLVAANGALSLDGSPVPRAALRETVRRVAGDVPTGVVPINILATASAPAGDLLDLVSVIGGEGIEVRLVALNKAKP